MEENANKLHFERTSHSANCWVRRPRTPFRPYRRQSQSQTTGTSEAEAQRTSCEQHSSHLSAPVHSASWNISDASPYK